MANKNAQAVQGSIPPNRPIKKYRIGNFSGVIWKNEKDMGENGIVSFLTASLRRSWKDKNTNDWREEKVNLRKADIAKAIVLLNKLQEDMLLTREGEDDE